MTCGSMVGKPICSICYEDLKPITEDLQAIPICGHVFHELCIQQWFEYCEQKKKVSCPICKQNCNVKNVYRLYFQSLGGANETILSQEPSHYRDDLESMRRTIFKLEDRISILSSLTEQQLKNINELSEKLNLESNLKREALKQKAASQNLLQLKSEELNTRISDCSKLKEKNVGLAKELATLKLVTDINLNEEEVLKLASFGNEGRTSDTIDVLRRSYFICNKRYTELMAKCNLLGRGEARALKKLDKAKEKIKQLKTNYQGLMTAIDIKNDDLRAIKASKEVRIGEICEDNVGTKSNSIINKKSSTEQAERSTKSIIDLDQNGYMIADSVDFRETKIHHPVEDTNAGDTTSFNGGISNILKENFASFTPSRLGDDKEHRTNNVLSDEKLLSLGTETTVQNKTFSPPCIIDPSEDIVHDLDASVDDKVPTLHDFVDDGVTETHPFQIKKQSPLSTSTHPSGEHCFAGGFMAPDGTTRHLGRWCKRVNNVPMPMKMSSASFGDLIASGADGRGGRVNILKSLSENPVVRKESSVSAKRPKLGAAKPNRNSHSRGCLQIEHFFQKAGQ